MLRALVSSHVLRLKASQGGRAGNSSSSISRLNICASMSRRHNRSLWWWWRASLSLGSRSRGCRIKAIDAMRILNPQSRGNAARWRRSGAASWGRIMVRLGCGALPYRSLEQSFFVWDFGTGRVRQRLWVLVATSLREGLILTSIAWPQ